ncbi:MAG: putative transposase [Flavobacteriales bacterium]|jgi:putative transposase
MSRLPRICPVDFAQHTIQRGNNRQICFGSEADLLPLLVG